MQGNVGINRVADDRGAGTTFSLDDDGQLVELAIRQINQNSAHDSLRYMICISYIPDRGYARPGLGAAGGAFA
ncbi:hypothetical protein EMIT0111MI5_10631 [Burkholderia sp. IT-111MI5]